MSSFPTESLCANAHCGVAEVIPRGMNVFSPLPRCAVRAKTWSRTAFLIPFFLDFSEPAASPIYRGPDGVQLKLAAVLSRDGV